MLHISKMSGKLLGIPAINTDTTSNPFCIRQKDTDTICGQCYSHRMLETYRKNCVPKFRQNSELLSEVIPTDDLPVLNYAYVRHDGHGELQNMAHLENFHRIALKNPRTDCTLWTKRRDLISQYHRKFTQPNNLILIYSNPIVDRIIAQVPNGFDRVFNNVSTDSLLNNCTGRNCIDCLICYAKTGENVIVEKVTIRH